MCFEMVDDKRQALGLYITFRRLAILHLTPDPRTLRAADTRDDVVDFDGFLLVW